ncbi:MAG: Rieske 2Fe-2S domain-containing protein [Propionibacteriales bacterium]|nr:Rieske 2Fe-2S domain-containing protein [Propionibacteriales bacterium]
MNQHDEKRGDLDLASGSSQELEVGDPFVNPGLHEHELRPTDVDPELEKRAERQVAGMFTLAAVLALGSGVAYLAIDRHAIFLNFNASNFAIGTCLGLALVLIGAGAIQWAKKLMGDHEIVEERHPARSSPEDRAVAVAEFETGAAESGFGRRKLIRNSLFGALGALGVPSVVLLGDLGPLPGNDLSRTVWRAGMRIVKDPTGEAIRPADIEIGTLVNAEPEVFFDEDMHMAHVEIQNAKAKAAVILVRMRPEEITPYGGRENWGIDGILCYSKICTHVGCPISLWEPDTHNLLCPCHQSTFDLANNGEVVFGPAARTLPQLPLALDDEGYIVATSDFREPVGPSYWERGGEEERA